LKGELATLKNISGNMGIPAFEFPELFFSRCRLILRVPERKRFSGSLKAFIHPRKHDGPTPANFQLMLCNGHRIVPGQEGYLKEIPSLQKTIISQQVAGNLTPRD
jgi:hypothetical protein